jgi:hypothetical protein
MLIKDFLKIKLKAKTDTAQATWSIPSIAIDFVEWTDITYWT